MLSLANKLYPPPPSEASLTQANQKQQKLIIGFDLLKFIMAIVVVNIHSGIFEAFKTGTLYDFGCSINKAAVPTFLVISAFLFFSKIRSTDGNGIKELIGFEKRANILYLFWIIVLTPFVLFNFHKEFLQLPVLDAITQFVKNYFFGYLFGASWYLGALIVGMPIIFLLQKILNARLLWIPTLLLHIYLFNANTESGLYAWYTENLRTPMLSFPNALVWLTIGFYLSDKRVIYWFQQIKNIWYVCILCIYILFSTIMPDYSYLFRLIAVPALVAWAYHATPLLNSNNCRKLRIYSTHIYCMHTSVLVVLNHLCVPTTYLRFAIACLICIAASELIIRIMSNKHFRWLKYSY